MATPTSTVLSLDALGTTGLKQSGGYLIEEFLRQLRGPKGIELLKEMTWNNPQIGAVRFLVHTLAKQCEWRVEPAKKPLDEAQAKEAADLIETSMNDMEHSWFDFIAEALSHADYGFSFHETVYKIRKGRSSVPAVNSKHNDGKFGWRKIELRSQDSLDRWEFDANNALLGFWQRDVYANRYVLIPCSQAVHFRTEKFKNNPEGRSIFRNAVIPYLRLKHIEEVEAIGVERDLAGIPFMQVPQEILARNPSAEHLAIRRTIETQLGQIRRDDREFIMMPAETNKEGKPTGFKFQLLASSGSRQLNIPEIKNGYKTDILMTSLAQFLQLGTQSATGSFALASSSTNLFTLALGAMLNGMEETINRQLVDPLCDFNKIEVENRPCIKHGDIEAPPLDEIATFLQALHTVGMLQPSPKMAQKLHDMADMPYDATQAEMQGGVKSAEQIVQEVQEKLKGIPNDQGK